MWASIVVVCVVAAVLVAMGLRVRVSARLLGHIQVNQPPGTTFEFIADPHNTPRWNPRIHAVQPEATGPVRLGYRYRYDVRGSGRVIACTAEVVEYQPGRRIVTSAVLGGSIKNVFGYSVDPSGTGSLLTGFGDARVSIFHAVVIRAIGTRRLDANLARMKTALES
jgi:uncharacterized protein YndB with AHSA1/START domain